MPTSTFIRKISQRSKNFKENSRELGSVSVPIRQALVVLVFEQNTGDFRCTVENHLRSVI
jgi:hypothetical protein